MPAATGFAGGWRRRLPGASRTLPVARSELPVGSVEITEVVSRRDRDDFLVLPWTIYAGDPHWVPPLLFERKAFINRRKHPFYRHGDARLFLARSGGATVGRILAADDPRFNRQHGTNVGTFGMFESIDDPSVAHALLDQAAAWLRERGRTAIEGPIDYSTNYACGLLVEGFDTPPRLMMNHNPPYYERLLTSWGLVKAKDLYAWWFNTAAEANRIAEWRPRVERLAARSGVHIRPIDRRRLAGELEICQRIYNESWRDNWGFVSMSAAEVEDMAKLMSHLADPNLVLLAEIAGNPVGFSITLPDYNEAIRPLNGRLTRFGLPIGLWRLFRNLRRIKTGRLLALGVVPGHRRRGVAELLVLQSFDYAHQQLAYTGAELSWTLEDNHLINRSIETVGSVRYKTYRVYERGIG